MKTRTFVLYLCLSVLACEDDLVAPTVPSAAFTVTPPAGWTDTEFLVDASTSSDPGDASSTLAVRWDWEDDGVWDTDWTIEKTATHVYSNLGRPTIRLEVKDPSGQMDQETHEVNVTNDLAPPSAAFTITPPAGWTDTEFLVDASTSSDPGDALSTLSVRWDWEDDGVWDTDWTTNKTATHLFTNEGPWTIRLEVQDPSGKMDQTTSAVYVTHNLAPESQITAWEPDLSTSFAVRVYWSGADADGLVQRYRIGWNDPDALDPVAAVEGLFVLTPGAHTFYVAAEDDEGRVDATPATLQLGVPHSLLSSPQAVVQALALAYRTRDTDLFKLLLTQDPARNAEFLFLLSEPTDLGETQWGYEEETRIHQRMFHPESPLPGDPPVAAELWLLEVAITLTPTENFSERPDLYSENGGLDGKLDPAIWRAMDARYSTYVLFDLAGSTDYKVEGQANFVVIEDLTKSPGDAGKLLIYVWEDMYGPAVQQAGITAVASQTWGAVKDLYR